MTEGEIVGWHHQSVDMSLSTGSSLLWVGFPLVVGSKGCSLLQCAGFSLWWWVSCCGARALDAWASVVAAHQLVTAGHGL